MREGAHKLHTIQQITVSKAIAQIKKTPMYHLFKTHTDCLLETTY